MVSKYTMYYILHNHDSMVLIFDVNWRQQFSILSNNRQFIWKLNFQSPIYYLRYKIHDMLLMREIIA